MKRLRRATPHRAPLTTERRPRRDAQRFDLRDRAAAANQLLLCGIVAVMFVVGLVSGVFQRPELFALGALIIGLGGIAALAVPWTRIPAGWVAVVPIVDIFAIALLRVADPPGGLGLLWIFPAMWLASLGRAGLITSCIVIPGLYWAVVALGPTPVFSFAALLLPLVIIAVSSAGYGSARRFAAQRELLDAQAARLAFARSAAVQQEQLVTEVLDTVDFGVVRFAVGGDVVYENDAVGRLGGAMPRLHAAADTHVLLREDGQTPLDAHEHPLARARRGESFEDETVWSEDAEGRRVALTFTARRLLDHRGADAGGVLVARDVTAEQEALRARDDLVASVSHELRTPLTSVLGYLELALDEDDLSERVRRYLETALGSGERLLAIIADILITSRRSRTSVEATVHPREVDALEVVRESVLALRPLAADRVIKVSVTGPDRAAVYADPGRLRQVIDNLLGNAIKFNRDGGAVDLAVTTDGEATTIEVRDTGVGIAVEDQQRVFERFFRASEDVAGNGLGLAITADIVRAHDGELTVTSEPGVGSTFTLVLPAHAEARMPR
ncbi:sensor histidine kinase [Microbacterium paulum]